MRTKEKETFESSLNKLEQIVRGLEDGDLPLEESLKLFEDGVRIARECRERLNQAERRIEILLADEEGNPSLGPLDSSELRGRSAETGKRFVFDDDEDEAF